MTKEKAKLKAKKAIQTIVRAAKELAEAEMLYCSGKQQQQSKRPKATNRIAV